VAAGFLAKLFGGDPTADWPPYSGRTPSFDAERGVFGPVRFGDPLEKCRALGKPTRTKGKPESALKLCYDPGGYEVVIEEGRFVGIYFDTSLDPDRRDSVAAVVSVGGMPVSGRTTPEEVRAWFGEPASQDDDPEYFELQYERGKVVMVFDFEKDSGLNGLDVFLDD
jgi:hypothetical protein